MYIYIYICVCVRAHAQEQVAIIVGSGTFGLATAACLSQLSIPYIILEREDCIASLWKKYSYDRLHLHLGKQFCELPHMSLPFSYPTYMPKKLFIQYLVDYVSVWQYLVDYVSASFYLYLLYFQQKVCSFSKISESQTDPLSPISTLVLCTKELWSLLSTVRLPRNGL